MIFFEIRYDELVPMEETECYKKDCIGLKTLNLRGDLHRFNSTGPHIIPNKEETKKFIVPYLR
jgi:hypothetical protein